MTFPSKTGRRPSKSDGIPFPGGLVYLDEGPADPSMGFRSLISFRSRQEATLHNRIRDMYTPQAASLGQYMSATEWVDYHSPAPAVVRLMEDPVTRWSDTPSTGAFVTGVGGTRLTLNGQDQIVNEIGWSASGSGIAESVDLPWWQQDVVTDSNGRRGLCDIALAASPSSPFWVFYLGSWRPYGGTSFAAPTMAGLMALVNERRIENGLPRAGFINPAIYTEPQVQAAFRDVTNGSTDLFSAGVGWDYPTGWGSPKAALLADALP